MRVLLVGGSGHVGSMITPYLLGRHQLTVLDLQPPRHNGVGWINGSITDPEALHRALTDTDVFVNLVMKSGQGGDSTEQSLSIIRDNYEVNTLGLHLLLFVAHEVGVIRGVHTSTMTVHLRDFRDRRVYPSEEEVPLDSPSVYGLTKGFGELICHYFARWFDMNIIALRLTAPRTRAQWLEERRNPAVFAHGGTLRYTDEEDLANAYLAAIDAVQVGHGRFDAIYIAGDEQEAEFNLSKARRILGWWPRTHGKDVLLRRPK